MNTPTPGVYTIFPGTNVKLYENLIHYTHKGDQALLGNLQKALHTPTPKNDPDMDLLAKIEQVLAYPRVGTTIEITDYGVFFTERRFSDPEKHANWIHVKRGELLKIRVIHGEIITLELLGNSETYLQIDFFNLRGNYRNIG